MGLLAFGLLLLILGLMGITTPIEGLGWTLVVLGAVLAVVDLAVGPRHPRGRASDEDRA